MSDSGTNFPPQTYSSVFNLNTLAEEEKNVNPEEEAEARSGSSPMLDCFVSSMYWKYFVIIFLSYLTIIKADETCVIEDSPKTRIFRTLVQYQGNKLSFNPHEQTYRGNFVSFNFSNIDRLERNAFRTFSSENVIGIDLSNKSIKKLDEEAFLSLYCLHYLDLSNNQILNLTKNMFQDLKNLRTLNISRNSLNELYESVFSNLHNIQILDISHNNISELDKSALADIATLEKLMLSYNKVKKIKHPYFNQLSHLKELYLDHNEIAVLPIIIFSKNVLLEKLDLSGNEMVIMDMQNDDSMLRSIKNLNLSDNYLITLLIENISYHFPNDDLTIDFNNNPFYCNVWKQYLKEFKEKHIKIAPGRNFSHEYNLDGIACDALNSSINDNDSEEDLYALNAKLGVDDKQYGARLNSTFGFIVREPNHKEGELSDNRAKYKTVEPDKSAFVRNGDPTAPSNFKEGTDGSDHRTIKGVTVGLAVIGMIFLIFVTLDYVLGTGFMIRMRKRMRGFVATPSDNDDAEYVTLTPPS